MSADAGQQGAGSWPADKERRKHPRKEYEGAKVWVASAEFQEVRTAHNFALDLINVSSGGVCILSNGRLRPGVKMNVEIHFSDYGGKLEGPATVTWSKEKEDAIGAGYHFTGLTFIGNPKMTGDVREFVTGEKVKTGPSLTLIERVRKKMGSEPGIAPVAGKVGSPTKKRRNKRILLVVLVVIAVYVASFFALAITGKYEAQDGRMVFRYLGKDSKGGLEKVLSFVYLPLHKGLAVIGLDLNYDRPQ